ncbi:hypothetical protein A3F00_03600 [Candidatus Daviesbacteria bacterium RIFCSPHIGHO2_12_FULL_37_11]|uniref:Type 4a pilus biogenesis protein PilO n=1 Tax=Candidatus Daviesbacteria bacterium RIFCSPHIGHO2_12_FULL_37_11 TaxID=1797777 RepID=A0A1F5KCR1_9BACT|nr:MAG: hypothetical protein A2111_02785 [Candidatus Daviesbacteria bacterium GWA1_38_6]OGE18001.1 MAG: hypothetical protein A2769_01040 [Candidatus Daviesbacteria bacterium RIFCSPHIGHO2_01_FULL_37_27]OGE38727.1 MAG: hypothetical protein A3F00_03600 [Candidatus Daviesbacteria bacterium RIFCSPHIGHO2_12_FULL_37_11]OGE45816.1 MAG: hypothetical protein A3B39_01140 [Candidatus Daviesbacteria bacterium RIFCSPLOWO2_01_FULL_37_10]
MTVKSTKYYRYYTYIEPVIKNPILKTYGYAIFTIVMIGVFMLFAIKPTLETIVLLQKKLTIQQDSLKKIDKKITDLDAAQTNYNKISSDTKSAIVSSLPSNADLANLIKSIELTTKDTDATISALQFQPISIDKKPGSNELKEITFTFNIEGSYGTLKTVLQNIYNGTRLIIIDKLSFNKVSSGNVLLMNVSGKAYYVK